MLKGEVPRHHHGKIKGLPNVVILSAFYVLLVLPSWQSAYARSSAQAVGIERWIRVQIDDPQAEPHFKEVRVVIDDVCDLLKRPGPGPYNPLPCWEKLMEGSKLLLSVAQKDRNAPPAIQKVIQEDLRRLGERERRWNALSQSEKNKRLRVLRTLADSIKRQGDDVQEGLRQVINDPKQDRYTRKTARRVSERFGRDICSVACVCVQAEGCPCCTYDELIVRSLLLNVH